MKTERNQIAIALEDCFISPNVVDSNFENANLVDVVDRAARNIGRVADGLLKIAAAIEDLRKENERA